MRVVLRKAPHARQPVQLAALLVTVHRTELRKTQRQVAVRTRLVAVYLAVVRAVHRLEQELFVLVRCPDGLERILAVFGVVSRCHVEVLHADMRRDDLLVTVSLLYALQEILKSLPQCRPLGQPHRKPLPHPRREHEELQLLA